MENQNLALTMKVYNNVCNITKHDDIKGDSSSDSGVVFDYEMKLVGLNIGGSTNWFGELKYGVMIPLVQA